MDKYIVILAGGSGERLWPLSTAEYPKQFLDVFGGRSLIRQTIARASQLVPIDHVLVVTSKTLASVTHAELPEIPKANFIFEPCRRNTAAAIASAAGVIKGYAGKDAMVAVFPADHLIGRRAEFCRLINQAWKIAEKGDQIVTLGIRATFPSTDYGYIEIQTGKFVEKPNEKLARRYVQSGKYVWNAGMFIFRVNALERILTEVAPELADHMRSVASAKSVSAVLSRRYRGMTNISFDYAVMERTNKIAVLVGDFGWCDVGGYMALAEQFDRDASSNVSVGSVRSWRCKGCTFIGRGERLTVFGLTDMLVVSSGRDVLVCPKRHASQLKKNLSMVN